ncbi:MAG: hypothetical protein LBQ80_04125 [Clostridium sp.]|jgi:hypothetical protein|nr:hypothetical protein [Clostridium sp.]
MAVLTQTIDASWLDIGGYTIVASNSTDGDNTWGAYRVGSTSAGWTYATAYIPWPRIREWIPTLWNQSLGTLTSWSAEVLWRTYVKSTGGTNSSRKVGVWYGSRSSTGNDITNLTQLINEKEPTTGTRGELSYTTGSNGTSTNNLTIVAGAYTPPDLFSNTSWINMSLDQPVIQFDVTWTYTPSDYGESKLYLDGVQIPVGKLNIGGQQVQKAYLNGTGVYRLAGQSY